MGKKVFDLVEQKDDEGAASMGDYKVALMNNKPVA